MAASQYVTKDEFKNHLVPVPTSATDDDLNAYAEAGSRQIDKICKRSFGAEAGDRTIEYRVKDYETGVIDVDDLDYATTTPIVKIRATLASSWETLTDGADYAFDEMYDPLDEADWPRWRLRMYTRSLTPAPWPTLQIMGRPGWPAVPEPIKRATLIASARLWARRSSPDGLREFGADVVARVARAADPDVERLVDRYCKLPVRV